MKKTNSIIMVLLTTIMALAVTTAQANETMTITLKNGQVITRNITAGTGCDSVRFVGGDYGSTTGVGVKYYPLNSNGVSEDYLYSQMNSLEIVSDVVPGAPVITPGSGTVYATTPITITADTGATVYYTTDGTAPTTASTQYTGPFTLSAANNATVTVKAIAVKNGNTSAVTSASFTFSDQVDNNVNANWRIAGKNIPQSKADPTFTNSSTDDYAWRLEYPHINTAGGNQRVVKAISEYGITYSLEWDNSKIANRWTCYTMCSKNNDSNVKRDDDFKTDNAVTTSPSTKYTESSTYSRGHLCPSADRLASTEQNHQTFYMTNMQPQYSNHNSGIWAKLEGYVRSKWQPTNSQDTLYVVKAATIADVTLNGSTSTGIITTTTDSSGHTLLVPKYFYMAFLYYTKSTGSYKAFAIWTEHLNNNNPTDQTVLNQNNGYIISIDELETRTGIDFFCNLPDDIETTVEATATYWDNSGN